MKHHCDIKRCKEPITIVYLTICAEGHIDEYYLCRQHAVVVWTHAKSCAYVHPIVDHMAATTNGDEPDDYRFYLGEWVAVVDGKVIKHGSDPTALADYAMQNGLAGTNIWQVQEEDMEVY